MMVQYKEALAVVVVLAQFCGVLAVPGEPTEEEIAIKSEKNIPQIFLKII